MSRMYLGTIMMLDLYVFILACIYIISICPFFKVNEVKLRESTSPRAIA